MIEYDFTYSVPDMFGTTATDNNFTAVETYIGPELFYVTLDENNKVYTPDDILIKDDLLSDEHINNWRDSKPFKLVDAKKETLVAYLLAQYTPPSEEEEEDILPEQKHFYLDDEPEPFFSHSLPIMIEEIYDANNIIYDEENDKFIVPIIDHSDLDGNDFFAARDENIADAKSLIQSGELSQDEIAALEKYINDYAGIEIKYADYPQHMWPRPDYPLVAEPEPGDEDHPDYVSETDDESATDENFE